MEGLEKPSMRTLPKIPKIPLIRKYIMYLRLHMYSQYTLSDVCTSSRVCKGAFTYYVSKILMILDPLPPLSAILH